MPYPVVGGTGAPIGASYTTTSADPTLTNERVLTDTATVAWDFSTPGQVKATATTAPQNAFVSIAVPTQATIVADSPTDTLNVAAGTSIAVTTDAVTDTLTISTSAALLGLGNVDNTSDANKPISTATQAALDLKADIASLPIYATATMNFGPVSARRATSSVDIAALSGLTSANYIDVFPMAEATADHSADGVRVDTVDYIGQFLSPTSVRVFGASRRGHTYGNRTVRVVIK